MDDNGFTEQVLQQLAVTFGNKLVQFENNNDDMDENEDEDED